MHLRGIEDLPGQDFVSIVLGIIVGIVELDPVPKPEPSSLLHQYAID